jgi:hypothetical protein
MRAVATQSPNVVVLRRWRWAGRGTLLVGLGWLLALPRRWWAAWPATARRLSDEPASFVNQR